MDTLLRKAAKLNRKKINGEIFIKKSMKQEAEKKQGATLLIRLFRPFNMAKKTISLAIGW